MSDDNHQGSSDNHQEGTSSPSSSSSNGILAQLKPLTAEERQEKMKALRAKQNAAVAASVESDSAADASAPSEPAVPTESKASPALVDKASDAGVPPRANMVEQAVRFLRAPNVQSAPMSKKLEFLRNKGLTEAEINTALQDASAASAGNTAAIASTPAPASGGPPALPPRIDYASHMVPPANYAPYAPMPPAPPAMTPQQFWRGVAMGAAVAAGLSAGSVALVKRYVVPFWTSRVDARQSDLQHRTNALSSLREALQASKSTLDHLTDAPVASLDPPQLPEVFARLDATQATLAREVEQLRDQAVSATFAATDTKLLQLHRDCKQEIRSIKGMMLNRRNFPSPVSSPLASTR